MSDLARGGTTCCAGYFRSRALRNSTPADTGSANNDNGYKRDACVYTERVLECGSIVSERNGKIIAKTSFLPTT